MPITQKRKRGKPNKSTGHAKKHASYKRRTSKEHNILPQYHAGYAEIAPAVIGLIYANWCHHCQALKPAWEEMKKHIKNKYNGQFTVVEIEADQPDKSEKLAKLEQMLDGEKIDASGYPTIVKVGGGRVDYYGGNRELNDMLNWATGGQRDEKQIGGFQKEKHLNKRSRSRTRKHTPLSK